MIKIGIVGFGRMGRRHYTKYQGIDHAQVTAIADVDVGALRWLADPHVARYEDPFEMIDRGLVDAIDVCAPTDAHASLSMSAILAGKHVICEKPMATRSSDAREMCDVARENDRLLLVANVVRYWPEYVRLRKVVEGGELGRLLSLSMVRYRSTPGWTRSPLPASVDLMLHDVDFVVSSLGTPAQLSGRTVLAPACEVCDGCGIVEGVHVNWRSTRRAGPDVFEASFAAEFEQGSVLYNSRSPLPRLEILNCYGIACSVNWYDPYERELREFVLAISRGSYGVAQEPETALASMRVMERVAGLGILRGDEKQ